MKLDALIWTVNDNNNDNYNDNNLEVLRIVLPFHCDVKCGPSDLGTKILQKVLKYHPYTHKAF